VSEVPVLGPLERRVMDVLWDSAEELTTREVLDRVGQPLAYTTIATVLTNLLRKELVDKLPLGRAWAYRARVRRSEYTAGVMASTLASGGDRRDALLHFVGSMSEDDVAVLRSLLEAERAQP